VDIHEGMMRASHTAPFDDNLDVASSAQRTDAPEVRARSPYVVSAGYDWAFFLMPPLVALAAGIAISGSAFSHDVFVLGGLEMTGAELFMNVVVHAHLVAVFFRSHGNPAIFALHPIRFVVVPIALWLAIMGSAWVAVASTVVATFWDVWHSGAQTFGFARIYERNAGVPPEAGRRLDYALNQLLYAGPILAGATLMDHVDSFRDFESVGDAFFSSVPAFVESERRYLTYAVLACGALFLVYYVVAHVRLARRGYPASPLKVFLLVSTGFCSIYSWGFNTWGEAFFIMNLFHAVQYLALVWAKERHVIAARLGRGGRPRGAALTALAYFGSVLAYGVMVALVDPAIETVWALTMVVSLMHFWYDAFIWSVRRAQV
jgi:hypothetical protein